MRRFECERCDAIVGFDAFTCSNCAADLGYLPAERALRKLEPGPAPSLFVIDGSDELLWRCLNSSWGCNWLLPAGSPEDWCRSCALTRGRPDEADPFAVEAWAIAEAAKRRLVHQLDELGLPIDQRSDSTPDGLTFDLVYVPGEPQVTGHLDGVITLDLTETDAAHRDDLRRAYDEPLRSVIGHLRHEIGHHYWRMLVRDAGLLDDFRSLFGDERDDYVEAITTHHRSWFLAPEDPDHITRYAAAHPMEDWAETFGHYLHVRDALGTADAAGLGVRLLRIDRPRPDPGFSSTFARWQRIAESINDVAGSLGSEPVYPFDPGAVVIEKLSFVDRCIGAAAARSSSSTLR